MMNRSITSERTSLNKDLIRASWRRCSKTYGLDRNGKHEVNVNDSGSLKEIRGSLDDMFASSSNILEHTRKIASDVGYIGLLSNADGIIVDCYKDAFASDDVSSIGLREGANWCEKFTGTNGIGTAIASRKPLTVYGDEHYYRSFTPYTCSAAPVFSSNGSVFAVINFSGLASPSLSKEYRFAEHFVREAAEHISLLLFRRQHQGDCLVTLSNEPDPLPMSSKAIVATNEKGLILGATQEAYAMLGVPELTDLGCRNIRDLWDVTLEDLKPLNSHSTALQLEDGAMAYATALIPKISKSYSASMKEKMCCAEVRPSKELKQSTRPLDRIAGSDPKLQGVINICRRILNKDLPILVLGETGVGKDVLARSIHEESDRRLRPFIAVNCAAIPESLLASELFGYKAGSFTGASRNGRVGKIQASDRGTLFLDEIGDMPLDLQAHLLRVLEERTVTPLGSTDAIPVNTKIICATHQDLSKLVQSGKFRRDLYFRIKGIEITMPSLRDRRDIAELAEKIAQEEIAGSGPQQSVFSDDVLDIFRNYSWPGNIRELRSVIRLVLSLYPDQFITPNLLPEELLTQPAYEPLMRRDKQTIGTTSLLHCSEGENAPTTLSELNEATEERMILDMLRAQKWNVTSAAKKLGVSRTTMHRKIRKYQIVSPNKSGPTIQPNSQSNL